MKSKITIALCMIGAGLLLLSMFSCDSSTMITSPNMYSGPKLTISENSFDFGYAPQYAKISHVFWLHSTGSEPLRIVKVVPG